MHVFYDVITCLIVRQKCWLCVRKCLFVCYKAFNYVWMNITLRLSEHTKSTLMLQRVDTANVNFRLKAFSKTHSNMWHMRLSASKHVIMNVQNALPKHVTLRLRKHTIPDTINAIREYWIIPWSWHVSPCQPSQPNCHVNCHAISDVEWTTVGNIHVSCNVEWKTAGNAHVASK
jgi:hypothetical protein